MQRRKFIKVLSILGWSSLVSDNGWAGFGNVVTSEQSHFTVQQHATLPEGLRPPKVGVIAVGGAACSMLRELHGRLPNLHRSIAIDKSCRALASSAAEHKLMLRLKQRGKVQADISVAPSISDAQWKELDNLIRGLDLVFIVSGLGGVAGSTVAPLVAERLTQNHVFNVAIAVLPFSYEGNRRISASHSALKALQSKALLTFPISNQALADKYPDSTLIDYILGLADDEFATIYKLILEPLSQDSITGFELESARMCLSKRGLGIYRAALL